MPLEVRHLPRRRTAQQQRALVRARRRAWFFGVVVLAIALFFLRGRFWHQPTPTADEIAEASSGTVVASPTPKPIRVGIQAGHWLNSDLPESEFPIMRVQGTGTSVNGVDEWSVNLEIAQALATRLRQEGIVVDVLPATIPPGYEADAFIAIHADGNEDTTVSGYKVAASEWDDSGKAHMLADDVELAYGQATNMRLDPSITDDMTQYFAFNYGRFQHAIAATTPGILVEVGFLTNDTDRAFLHNHPTQVAAALEPGILKYLREDAHATPSPKPSSSPEDDDTSVPYNP